MSKNIKNTIRTSDHFAAFFFRTQAIPRHAVPSNSMAEIGIAESLVSGSLPSVIGSVVGSSVGSGSAPVEGSAGSVVDSSVGSVVGSSVGTVVGYSGGTVVGSSVGTVVGAVDSPQPPLSAILCASNSVAACLTLREI